MPILLNKSMALLSVKKIFSINAQKLEYTPTSSSSGRRVYIVSVLCILNINVNQSLELYEIIT